MPAPPDPRSIRAFKNAKAFEAWLAANHDKKPELYVRIYKKDSGVATVTHAQAVDAALCWGWIDGIRKAYDDTSFLQRFTPRRPKSIWSRINREHVARLVAEGRMTAHGLKHVDAAKADGRWDAAYEPARTMTLPEDLLSAIRADDKARQTFEALDAQNRYALAFRMHHIKTAAGRATRIAAFVSMLRRGERIHAKPATKARRRGPTGAAR